MLTWISHIEINFNCLSLLVPQRKQFSIFSIIIATGSILMITTSAAARECHCVQHSWMYQQSTTSWSASLRSCARIVIVSLINKKTFSLSFNFNCVLFIFHIFCIVEASFVLASKQCQSLEIIILFLFAYAADVYEFFKFFFRETFCDYVDVDKLRISHIIDYRLAKCSAFIRHSFLTCHKIILVCLQCKWPKTTHDFLSIFLTDKTRGTKNPVETKKKKFVCPPTFSSLTPPNFVSALNAGFFDKINQL